jgi:hypothetical protein
LVVDGVAKLRSGGGKIALASLVVGSEGAIELRVGGADFAAGQLDYLALTSATFAGISLVCGFFCACFIVVDLGTLRVSFRFNETLITPTKGQEFEFVCKRSCFAIVVVMYSHSINRSVYIPADNVEDVCYWRQRQCDAGWRQSHCSFNR